MSGDGFDSTVEVTVGKMMEEEEQLTSKEKELVFAEEQVRIAFLDSDSSSVVKKLIRSSLKSSKHSSH